jgi:glutaredoxin
MTTRMTLLSQPDCGLCDGAKEILHRLSMEFEFTVDEVDLFSSLGRELAQEHAVPIAPGLVIDGALFSCGRLSERRLRLTLSSIKPIGA